MKNLLTKNMASPEFNLKISMHWSIRWISLLGIVFSLWIAFLTRLNNDGIGLFLFFVLFSLFAFLGLLLSFSTIRVNQKSIITTMLHTTYKIDWDEVKTIETDGGTIAFFSENKCFPIQLGMTNAKEKARFERFLKGLIDKRQIEVKPLSSLLLTHKNTKVQNGES